MENGYLVQWTERQRLEYHPEYAGSDYEVLLGLLGRELTNGLNGPRFRSTVSINDKQPPNGGTGGGQGNGQSLSFKETGHTIDGLFLQYWQAHGSLRIFGYPISNVYTDGTLQIQWFERARMEIHPENPSETRVLLGLLSYEALKARNYSPYEAQIFGNPAPDTNMEIGL